jgi:hypothetical protein
MSKTFADLVKEIFPDATDDFVEFTLWTHTGYPSFWLTDNPEAECREQLRELREGKNG